MKSCSKSSFGVKSAAVKKLKWGSVILTRFASLICVGIFCANMTSIWGHYFRAKWPSQRKSCVRDVICLSPPSMAEGVPAFWHPVWQCVEGRRAVGNYSWKAKGRNRQRFTQQRSFDHSNGKKWTKPSSNNFPFALLTFVILPIYSNQVHFKKVDV